jgi:hypothetical protein
MAEQIEVQREPPSKTRKIQHVRVQNAQSTVDLKVVNDSCETLFEITVKVDQLQHITTEEFFDVCFFSNYY